jgi:leucyl-tRNA synthetase
LPPHIAEEFSEALGHTDSIVHSRWPEFDPAALGDETIAVVVQVNGKVRGRVELPREATEETVKERALAAPGVQSGLAGKAVRRTIIAPGKLINLVVAE